jgi:hypothetical protein
MVSVLDSSAVDYKIGICCFSAKQAALERKNTDWLARNQDNVSEWGDMSIHRLLFQVWMLPLLLVELIHVKQTHHKEDLQIYQGKGIIVIGEDLYRPSLVSNHFEFINNFKAPNLPLSLRFKGSGCHCNSI